MLERIAFKPSLLSLFVALCLLLVSLPALAERGDDSKRKSKNGKVEGTIDGVAVTVEYGRPGVKGRDIWGGLVPYGKVWRTGADEATTITFASDVMIEGKKLPAGTYALFTIPEKASWTVVFNSVADQWGAYSYDSSQDALRVEVTPKTVEAQEILDFQLEDDQVILRWAELAVPFTVTAAS